MTRLKNIALAAISTLLFIGCGSTDPGAPPGGDGGNSCQLSSGDLLPWKVGNKWTYRVTEDGQPSMKVTTIEAEQPVGGTGPNAAKTANRVVTKKGLMDQTISWQALTGSKVVRYREQSFNATTGTMELEEHWDPYKLHIDGAAEHMKLGGWNENYRETKLPVGGVEDTRSTLDRWTVLAECEPVQVEGKSWNALKVSKTGGDIPKTYWYVPGVGKVKETGGQTEELLQFEAAP